MVTTSAPSHPIHAMTDDEPSMAIDPRSVTCGFMMFPVALGNPPLPVVHQALETNQSKLWPAVRRNNDSIKIHLLAATGDLDVRAIPKALDAVGELRGRTVVVGQMNLGPPGGSAKAGFEIYVGFCFADDDSRIIVAKSNRVVPLTNETVKSPSGVSSRMRVATCEAAEVPTRKWWEFWKS